MLRVIDKDETRHQTGRDGAPGTGGSNRGADRQSEIARTFFDHISFRTAARIVEKLEQNGYIVEVGRSVLNGRGRPTRVFPLLR